MPADKSLFGVSCNCCAHDRKVVLHGRLVLLFAQLGELLDVFRRLLVSSWFAARVNTIIASRHGLLMMFGSHQFLRQC